MINVSPEIQLYDFKELAAALKVSWQLIYKYQEKGMKPFNEYTQEMIDSHEIPNKAHWNLEYAKQWRLEFLNREK